DLQLRDCFHDQHHRHPRRQYQQHATEQRGLKECEELFHIAEPISSSPFCPSYLRLRARRPACLRCAVLPNSQWQITDNFLLHKTALVRPRMPSLATFQNESSQPRPPKSSDH